MWGKNFSGRGSRALERGKKPDWLESTLLAPPSLPVPLATAVDTCLQHIHLEYSSLALMDCPQFPQPCLTSPSRRERHL